MHRFLLHNDEICDATERNLSAGQVGLLSGWGVFSTLRIYDGVLFAWERHWERMRRDAERMRVPFPSSPEWLVERLHRLIDANHPVIDHNQAANATLRVSVIRNRGGLWEGPGAQRDFDVIAFTADVNPWPERVKLCLAANARHAASEFAGTKYTSWSENLTRYERVHEQGLDEVVLLNERGEVSECTSANIFVVADGGLVWTPPIASGCLAGVTRAVLLEEIAVPGITVAEKSLFPEDLEAAAEIWITSTTRELLPVSSIEGLRIRQGTAIGRRLWEAFRAAVESYVSPRRKPLAAV